MKRHFRKLNGRKPGNAVVQSLDDVLALELQDLLHTEQILVDLLPELRKRAEYAELSLIFQEQERNARRQAQRFEQILEVLDSKASAPDLCPGDSLLSYMFELSGLEATPAARDALLVSGFRKILLFEIAGIRSALAFAEHLGDEFCIETLHIALEEQRSVDSMLDELASELIDRKIE